MPELAEYELPDGTTMQLSEEDAKRFPDAKKKAGPHAKPAGHEHEPVRDRARRR